MTLWHWLTFTLALLCLWQWSRLLHVLRWLQRGERHGAPGFGGRWGELIASAARVMRRKEYHKQRLARVMQDVRDSTAAMPDGVVLLNPQAEIQWFNPVAGKLLGLSGQSDQGIRIDHLVRQPEFVRYLHDRQYASPVLVRQGPDPERYLTLQLAPYGSGQMLLLARDVTQQSQLDAMRRDFVANASHELRTPLTVISGYLETLTQDAVVDTALVGPLVEMRRQAQRMNAIVHDLLELSRLEGSDEPIRGVAVDVAAILKQLQIEVLARAVHPSQVDLVVDAELLLLGDEAMIHSIAVNLIDNAAKYTPTTQSMSIRWWCDSEGAHLQVSDTGIGISAEHLPRLTERFYRVDAGRSRATGGSGLGLAIVKHALQRHGATLSISSVEGQGSQFYCHFPPPRVRRAQRVVAL